ncbi:MAG: haloalkane dehalogenase [Acidimicrobiaceae bacterium]|nr:haloalkane dehalogenase [Acidimicrobiaceae bacterium]|tara:strand:+ start:7310 stop:8236 length:927 start_codon:yes stop_codon:yes gene_type:complete
MQTIRTPEERFVDLIDYPFQPNYAEVFGRNSSLIRIHYLDEGPIDSNPIVLLHGEPSWSYLYRHIIPLLVNEGHRVIVPDLVGFGKSDKPVEQTDYSYARHVEWMAELLFAHLNLTSITFFGQDWGGLIGLRLVAREPDRYDRIIIGNTGLPTGKGEATEAFLAWQKFSQTAPEFPIGKLINSACVRDLTDKEIQAYDAPFPTDEYKAGARIFPSLVPTSLDDPASQDNIEAWDVLSEYEKPFLLAFSDSDPVTKGGDAPFHAKVPGTKGQNHVTVENAGHFLQEDKSKELAAIMNDFIAHTSERGGS